MIKATLLSFFYINLFGINFSKDFTTLGSSSLTDFTVFSETLFQRSIATKLILLQPLHQ